VKTVFFDVFFSVKFNRFQGFHYPQIIAKPTIFDILINVGLYLPDFDQDPPLQAGL